MIINGLSTLKINKLSQSQYERELQADNIDEFQLYLTPKGTTPISEGGTGATTAKDALTNLGAAPSSNLGGVVFSYLDGKFYAQYGDDASTKKALGEIDKNLLLEALANSGLGLTQDSTAEEIYSALKASYQGEFYDICGRFVGDLAKTDTKFPDVLKTSSGGEQYSPSVAAVRYVSHSKPINFTNIDSITFTLNIDFNNANDYFYNVGDVRAGLSRMQGSFDDLGYVNISKSGGYTSDGYNIISDNSQTFTIDTTNLNGSYYLVLAVYCANANSPSDTYLYTGTIGWITDVVLKYSTDMEYTVSHELFTNGEFTGELTLTGATISDGSINALAQSHATDDGSTEATEEKVTVVISGIDLTDYDTLYVKSVSETANHYGVAYCNWGIDNANSRFYTVADTDGLATRTYENLLDVSSYTGVHDLVFYLYAYSDSSYTGYWSQASLGITDIVLYG